MSRMVCHVCGGCGVVDGPSVEESAKEFIDREMRDPDSPIRAQIIRMVVEKWHASQVGEGAFR